MTGKIEEPQTRVRGRSGRGANESGSVLPSEAISLAAAEAIADRLGTTPEELIAVAMRIADASEYPTPVCLQASELESYAAGVPLLPRLAQHVTECRGCMALLGVAKPPEKFERAFREAVIKRQQENDSSPGGIFSTFRRFFTRGTHGEGDAQSKRSTVAGV